MTCFLLVTLQKAKKLIGTPCGHGGFATRRSTGLTLPTLSKND